MVLWISKIQFWQQCSKNFAKTQNVFCSKSGNLSNKILSLGNFLFSQNKLLFTYVEGSVDNRAESSPSKARIFLIKFQKWQKARKNFSKTNFCSKCSSLQEEFSFEKTVPKFHVVNLPTVLAHISKRIEI